MRPRFLVLALVAWSASAEANQVVKVSMNKRQHEVSVPDGWSAKSTEGGVFVTPPPGTAPSVEVLIGGFDKTGVNPNEPAAVVNSLLDDDVKAHAGATKSELVTRTFVGGAGQQALVQWTEADKTHMGTFYMAAVVGDTLYMFRARGKWDDLAKVVGELDKMVTSVKASDADGRGATSWTDERPLPEPPTTQALLADELMGVNVGYLPGWGVLMGPQNYVLERRLSASQRLVVNVYVSDVPFEGNGDAYVAEVAKKGGFAYQWDRFAKRTTLVVKKPPAIEGAGDVWEFHVMREGRPAVFQFRLDGGRWGEGSARAALATKNELEALVRVDDPPAAPKTVTVGDGSAVVPAVRRWSYDHYGPGAAAWFRGPGLSAIVIALTSRPSSAWQCEQNQPSAEKAVSVNGHPTREFRCPNDNATQLVYSIARGDGAVYVAFTFESKAKARDGEKEAASFLKAVRLGK